MEREKRLDVWLRNVRFPNMKKGLNKIAKDDRESIDEGRLIITGREFGVTFGREELLSNFMLTLKLFNYKHYLIVMIYDELEAFIDQSFRNVDVIKYFLELFIKKLIDPDNKLYYLYILFTCENESYEKIFVHSKPTGHRLRNKLITLQKMEKSELYDLADKIYDTHPHLKAVGVSRPLKEDCDNIIEEMDIYTDTRSFIQKFAMKLNDEYRLHSKNYVQVTEKYEKQSFDVWKIRMIEWGCKEEDIYSGYIDKFGIRLDGYAEKRTIGDKLVGIGIMEATIRKVDTVKADDFIRKKNVYRSHELFDPKKDKATIIAPKFSEGIRKHLKRNNIDIKIFDISEGDLEEHRGRYQEKPKVKVLNKSEGKMVKYKIGIPWDPNNKTPEMLLLEKEIEFIQCLRFFPLFLSSKIR